jgi:hypothetical protein
LRVKTGGILPYFEDLKRGTSKMKLIRLWRVGPKDISEIASSMKEWVFHWKLRRKVMRKTIFKGRERRCYVRVDTELPMRFRIYGRASDKKRKAVLKGYLLKIDFRW